VTELDQWLAEAESTTREYKSAQGGYSRSDAMRYCAAFANCEGGTFILGVDDSRQVVGTGAFQGTHHDFEHELFQRLGLQIEIEELQHPKGRVLIFHVPKHRAGIPVAVDGKYWMRAGSSIVEMDEVKLRSIVNEVEEDFSARMVPGLTIADLDDGAVENFKQRLSEKMRNPALARSPTEQVLRDAQLMTQAGYTYACLILLGKAEKIAELMPQAEIIYEWRGTTSQTHHDFRMSWKAPYFAVYDQIWETINARNLRTPYQEGFVQREILAFDEKSCREALNNAVAHRDYVVRGRSIIVRASPVTLIVESPGGFPSGITPENALHETHWRNRLLAEAFERTGLVERSGQGLDSIFEASIRQGKGLPDFGGTSTHAVQINIPATVHDKEFIRFLEKVANEKQIVFTLDELIELENIRTQGKVSTPVFRQRFMELGLVEQHGKTRGAKYTLSHRYYTSTGLSGVHTRLTGLPREARKKLILLHIQKNGKGQMHEFQQTFPDMQRKDISNLLQDLRNEGIIEHEGSRSKGHWTLSNKLDLKSQDNGAPSHTNGLNKPL
jgi:ATP-dependent DNA helicase RecG